MGRRHTKRYETSSSESESSYSSDSSRSSVSESELDEVECKLTKKIEGLYCKILWNLRREPCLMLNGSDAHVSVYSYTQHTTLPGGNIVFDLAQYATNVDYTNGDDYIIVRRTGLYYFAWSLILNEPCQLGIFINTVLDPSTVVGNNSGATVTAASQMLRLISGDRIELRNLGLNPITSASPAVGNPLLPSQNVDFTIFKIAPNRDVCGDFPIPFEKGRCCDNVEKWNCADKNNDGQISACEEKDYHRDHGYECPPPCPPVPCPPTPCDKDDKCEKKFEKLDCNKDNQLSLEEYKKGCEKRKHKHHRHRHHSRDSRRH
jgi:hypothetical protein